MEWFADQVRERTDGRVNIEVYNNGTLGDAISCLEQLQYGGMDIVKADLSTMTNFVDEYNALMMPYIYKIQSISGRYMAGISVWESCAGIR